MVKTTAVASTPAAVKASKAPKAAAPVPSTSATPASKTNTETKSKRRRYVWERSVKIACDPFAKRRRVQRAADLKDGKATTESKARLTTAQKDQQVVRQIQYYQKSKKDLIQYRKHAQLAREILQDVAPDASWQRGALIILRSAAERMITQRFQRANRIAVAQDNSTLSVEHTHLADSLRDEPFLDTLVFQREKERFQKEVKMLADAAAERKEKRAEQNARAAARAAAAATA